MMKKNNGNYGTTGEFEKSLARPRREEQYVLRLYVTGMTPRSTEAFARIKAICEEHLQGRYDLQVIDIYQHPELARDEQIIAAPTLVKKLPAPLRRLIGNLAAEERVLLGLDLRRNTNQSIS
jgi:circadian clock protein KaiB